MAVACSTGFPVGVPALGRWSMDWPCRDQSAGCTRGLSGLRRPPSQGLAVRRRLAVLILVGSGVMDEDTLIALRRELEVARAERDVARAEADELRGQVVVLQAAADRAARRGVRPGRGGPSGVRRGGAAMTAKAHREDPHLSEKGQLHSGSSATETLMSGLGVRNVDGRRQDARAARRRDQGGAARWLVTVKSPSSSWLTDAARRAADDELRASRAPRSRVIPPFDGAAGGGSLGLPMCQNRFAVPTWSYAMERRPPARIVRDRARTAAGFTVGDRRARLAHRRAASSLLTSRGPTRASRRSPRSSASSSAWAACGTSSASSPS